MGGQDETLAFSELRAALGPVGFLTDDDIPVRNHADASVLRSQKPLAVLRPATTDEVSVALAIANRHRLPITTQGGLTGLCGGATPAPGSLALSLERMVGIEEIDGRAMTLTARAGTPLEAMQQAAEAEGFLFPIDFGARGTATAGGIVSTNAGGNRVLRYGMTRASVLGLEAVLVDGTVIGSPNKMLKNNAGPDLKQLFVGSEGLLGVVTRTVFALQPLPRWTGLALIAVRDFEDAADVLASARAELGPMLSAFEVMWPDYWAMVTENVAGRRDPFAERHGLYLLVEGHGRDGARDGATFEAFLEGIFEAGLVADAMLAQSLSDMEAFWAIRDASAEIEPVLGEHESFDVGLPPGEVGRFVEACRSELAKRLPASRAVFFGHAADGNIHVMASVEEPGPTGHHDVESVVYGVTRRFTGSVSAEHGIGALKRDWLGHSRSQAEIALVRSLKVALDPHGLLNPGKVI
ncbi:FAD-binding oxidoreductase [Pleomorphomonas sp. NRK KF1]|uniref:FAD-binding oxidoreductase n=1 Tax=Pleomorphomonas sp. NRK KF1 TaxID=2943000 RepID=UPI00204326E9|nr:FAD-binding oxidoreductase [Pleomorphomonas sp. NRK KF1]MCM5553531.1 FAD-binding oxidoreductase [Pleomorphomonas sp. NRK KF1]